METIAFAEALEKCVLPGHNRMQESQDVQDARFAAIRAMGARQEGQFGK
jgi:hypothetical protein